MFTGCHTQVYVSKCYKVLRNAEFTIKLSFENAIFYFPAIRNIILQEKFRIISQGFPKFFN